jgi:hypothetical protein
MTGVDDRLGMGRFAGGIVEKQDDVVMQRSLITLQGQGIFAALIHNGGRWRAGS